jgi:pilus assembly protein Flp/PilA
MLKKFFAKMQNEEGQGLVEYALIIVLVSIVVIAALSLLGTNVSTVFSNIAETLTPAGGGS